MRARASPVSAREGSAVSVERLLDIEFSLALNNKTGKYFAAKGMVDAQTSLIGAVRYWRISHRREPRGLYARILGRMMTLEVDARVIVPAFDRIMPKLRPSRPVLFTDPLQVILYSLTSSDIVVVHDMGPITHPQFYAPRVHDIYYKAFRAIQEARCHLIFVSEASDREHADLFGASSASRRVIYNPIRSEAVKGVEEAPLGVSPPFFLTVGAVGDRKNQRKTIEAFQRGCFAERGYQYVICGASEPGASEVILHAEKTAGVRMVGYASASELRWLYSHAEGFVLASHLEGFGMPAAEALINGLLPVVSRDGALVEVAGPQAIFVDADDVGSIERGLNELATLPAAEKQARVLRARNGLEAFSEDRVLTAWRAFFTEMVQPEISTSGREQASFASAAPRP